MYDAKFKASVYFHYIISSSLHHDNRDFHIMFNRRTKALIEELSEPPAGSTDLHFRNQYSQSFLMQCLACLWKQNLSYWRNPAYNAVRLFFTTIIALIFGTIFWDLGGKT
jgi:hypothetical protein